MIEEQKKADEKLRNEEMKVEEVHTIAQGTFLDWSKERSRRQLLDIELNRTKKQLEKTTKEKNDLAALAATQKTTIIERNRTVKANEDTIAAHEATIKKLEAKYKKYKALYLELLNKTPDPLVEINERLGRKLTKVTKKFSDIVNIRACAKHKEV